MKWYRAFLYGLKQADHMPTDVMGNPVCTERELGSILVRVAPVRPVRDDTEGNAHSYVERCFTTKAEWDLLEGANAIEVKGVRYSILHIALGDGWSIITCRCDREKVHG